MDDDMRTLAVTDAAATQDLTTVAAVKDELGLVTNEHDMKLLGWIHEQSRVVADHCNRVFGAETVTETIQLATPRRTIALRRWPNIAAVTVTEDGVAVAASGYRIVDESGILHRLSGGAAGWWPCGVDIVIAYRAGYELLDALPEPIERVTKTLVKAQWHASRRDPYLRGEQIEGIGRFDYWVGDTPGSRDQILAALDAYRNPVI